MFKRRVMSSLLFGLSSPKSQQSRTPPSVPLQLCGICQAYDLTIADFIVLPHTVSRDLHPSERQYVEIRGNTQCPLCLLICKAVERFRNINQIEPADLLCQLRFDHYVDGNLIGRPTFAILKLVAVCPSRDIKFSQHFVPLECEPGSLRFLGRTINPWRIDCRLVRSWIHECTTYHEGNCEKVGRIGLRRLQVPLRVIDIRDDCLTTLPDGQAYAALSYVWGNVKALRTFQKDIPAFSKRKGLGDLKQDLPRVIQDAMQVIADIDLRYLWVDTLCIVQDDNEVKYMTIEQMDVIYSNAFVTLVAATGSDASAGLPGVRPYSRGHEQSIADIGSSLQLLLPDDRVSLERSRWASRGWTYQEYYFSKRRLIFINGQVWYKCQKKTEREDLKAAYYPYNLSGLYEMPGMQHSEIGDPEKHFQDSVEEYTKRQLTHEYDALNAFAGVSNHLQTIAGFSAIFGIPKQHLGFNLLWDERGPLKRRREFPSWSWAGWIGPVRFPWRITFESARDPVQRIWFRIFSELPYYLFSPQDHEFHIIYAAPGMDRKYPRSMESSQASLALDRSTSNTGDETFRLPSRSTVPLVRSETESHITGPITQWKGKQAIPNYSTNARPASRRHPADYLRKEYHDNLWTTYSRPIPRHIPFSQSVLPHALLFRTLTAQLHLTAYRGRWTTPDRIYSTTTSTNTANSDADVLAFSLLDTTGAFAGLARLSSDFDQERVAASATAARCIEDEAFLSVEVAVIAGPVIASQEFTRESEERARQNGDGDTFGEGHAFPEPRRAHSASVVEVMGSTNMGPRGDAAKGVFKIILLGPLRGPGASTEYYGVRERIGVGQVWEDVFWRLDGLGWREVVLQ
ncbi:heterokaryon incompatibility protein-domain-containing protein [Lineolata rhizophorae]|uniref:Heterokaryon incompatibility protein-domain-containing protein n=1 Tax=Lineolata rhizophorae TaxID=578093 RepID=A0A6A6PDB5_9PEZI|nr:heterokaryon incompatibility protein-domain-containing protein [Lineolata rhizophorae]